MARKGYRKPVKAKAATSPLRDGRAVAGLRQYAGKCRPGIFIVSLARHAIKTYCVVKAVPVLRRDALPGSCVLAVAS